MKKYYLLFFLSLVLFAFAKKINTRDGQAGIRNAVTKSLPLLQTTSHTFLINAVSCHSCHSQGIGVVAFSMAGAHGFNCDSTIDEALDSTRNYYKNVAFRQAMPENDDPVAIVMAGNYDLWALSAGHAAADKRMTQLAFSIMRQQNYDGRWTSPGQRPPLEYYDMTATALAVKNIQEFVPAAWQPEVRERVAKAKQWISHFIPQTNEERVFQLLGLTWCDGNKALMEKRAAQLVLTQQLDGGWSQLDSLPTDAYATGQALYALQQSGQLLCTDTAYQKGIQFLLNTQYPDGSWKVITRSYPFVPYVKSGFPHGPNEFISAAGTNWATIALLLAMQ